MKILINDGISAEGEKILIDNGFEVVNKSFPQDQLPSIIKEYDAIIVRSATTVRKDLIDQSNLKVIARSGVGMDNIDVDYARSIGIQVLNTPGASSISVAELTIAHILGLLRFLHRSNAEMRNGSWPKKAYSEGREVTGKTLGLIGLGAIGREVAKRANGLMMNVIAFDPFIKETNENVTLVDFDYLLLNSDIISLHIPLDKSKGAIISEAELNKMKNGVVIINCARGGVIDEKDLLNALNSGKVANAGLDVFVDEPITDNQKELISHPNVSITPHIGASTNEAQERVSIEIAEKVSIALKNL